MLYELIFRGSLVQYWNKLHAEWQRPSRKDPLAQGPFRLSHPLPPKEFEEVTIEFLDNQRRLGLVTVDALSGADGKLVKLIVHIQQEAYEEAGETALKQWNKLKNTWKRKGWLTDPLAQVHQRVVKPKEPAKPKSGSHLNLWFDWYHARQAGGFKCTLEDIATEVSRNYGYVRQLHANYARARGLLRSKKKT